MQDSEITIGQVVYDIDRVYSETRKIAELIRERIEKEAAAIDREERRAV